MRRLLSIIFIISYFTLHAQFGSDAYYHRWQSEMISQLRQILGFNVSLDLKYVRSDIKAMSNSELYTQYRDTLINGYLPDVMTFLNLSRMLSGSKELLVFHHPSYAAWYEIPQLTSSEIDEIAFWWRENEKYITPDFMDDIFFDYATLSFSELVDTTKDRNRFAERLDFRKKRKNSCTNDSINWYKKDKPADRVEIMFMEPIAIQKHLNSFHDGKRIFTIDAFIPRGDAFNYVVITKLGMTGQEIDYPVPVTRREFEDMKDWWYVYGCDYDFKSFDFIANSNIGWFN